MNRETEPGRRRARSGVLVASACVLVAVTSLGALTLEERTRQAYDAYADQARRLFLEHVPKDEARWPADDPARAGRLRAGVIFAGPRQEDGIIEVPGGLVHHWVGAAFIPNVTLDAALRLSQTFSEYASIYKSIIASEFLGREGDAFRVRLRIEERASVVTAVMDVWSTIRFVRVSDDRAYSLSDATEIREVVDAGQPNERLLPAGEDRGFLWAANIFTKYVEREGGVYVEVETIALSRGFPPLLGWVVEPIARRLGRKSIEGSLKEFREALVRSTKQPSG